MSHKPQHRSAGWLTPALATTAPSPCRIALVYWWFAYRILHRKQPRYQPLEAPKAA